MDIDNRTYTSGHVNITIDGNENLSRTHSVISADSMALPVLPIKISMPPEAQKLIDIVNSAGFECFAVGGCVRDALLNRKATDWDFATNAAPTQMQQVFSKHRLFWKATGATHGTITVWIDRYSFEITTYRIDGASSDNRHPDNVRFTRNLVEDLARRDFTINAMAFSPASGLIDIYGGQADLLGSLVRTVGNPLDRFEEDALRILRALRFGATLQFDIELQTASAIHASVPLLAKLSHERVFSELSKLLIAQDGDFLAELISAFNDVISMALYARPMAHLHSSNIQALAFSVPKPALRWALLLRQVSYDRENVEPLRQLKAPRRLIATVDHLLRLLEKEINTSPADVRRLLAQCGSKTIFNLYLSAQEAWARGQSDQDLTCKLVTLKNSAQKLIDNNFPFTTKNLALTGKDLLNLGFPANATLSATLKKLHNAVVEQGISNDRQTLTAYLKNI